MLKLAFDTYKFGMAPLAAMWHLVRREHATSSFMPHRNRSSQST
jgi:hypothetical protein